MVRVADLIFIVTDAHVLEDLGTGPRYVGVLDQWMPLPDLRFMSSAPSSGRDHDRLDLGVWCLIRRPRRKSRLQTRLRSPL